MKSLEARERNRGSDVVIPSPPGWTPGRLVERLRIKITNRSVAANAFSR